MAARAQPVPIPAIDFVLKLEWLDIVGREVLFPAVEFAGDEASVTFSKSARTALEDQEEANLLPLAIEQLAS